MGTGKQKTAREKHRIADDPGGRKAVGSSKLPVPYREAQQADAVEAAQIILRKGEWSIEIRNGADVTLLRQVLEMLR